MDKNLIKKDDVIKWIEAQRESVAKMQSVGGNVFVTREDLIAIQRCLSGFETFIKKCEESNEPKRVADTKDVLNHILNEYRNKRLCNLDILLVHCINKLNGNIDDVKLNLENKKGEPFVLADDWSEAIRKEVPDADE